MNVQRTNITLPTDLLAQMQRTIPQGARSKFIATAIIEKLGKQKTQKQALAESLKANAEFDKKVAKEWEVTEIEGWPE